MLRSLKYLHMANFSHKLCSPSYEKSTRVLQHHPPKAHSRRFITARSPFGLHSLISCLTFATQNSAGSSAASCSAFYDFPSRSFPEITTDCPSLASGGGHNHTCCPANWRNFAGGMEGGRERGMDGGNEGRGESADKRLQSRLTNCRQS